MPPKLARKSPGKSGGKYSGEDPSNAGDDLGSGAEDRPLPCPRELMPARQRAVARFSLALLGRGIVSRKTVMVILSEIVAEEETLLKNPPPACGAKVTKPCIAPGSEKTGPRGCATHCVCRVDEKRGLCASGLASHLNVKTALILANRGLGELGLALRKCRCEQTGALFIAAVNELNDDIAAFGAADARDSWQVQLFLWLFRSLTEGIHSQERCAPRRDIAAAFLDEARTRSASVGGGRMPTLWEADAALDRLIREGWLVEVASRRDHLSLGVRSLAELRDTIAAAVEERCPMCREPVVFGIRVMQRGAGGEETERLMHAHCELKPGADGKLEASREAENGFDLSATALRDQKKAFESAIAVSAEELGSNFVKPAAGSAITQSAATRRALYGIAGLGEHSQRSRAASHRRARSDQAEDDTESEGGGTEGGEGVSRSDVDAASVLGRKRPRAEPAAAHAAVETTAGGDNGSGNGEGDGREESAPMTAPKLPLGLQKKRKAAAETSSDTA